MAKKYSKKGRKARSAGRFGPRYGRKSRKLVGDIEEQMRGPHRCPQCGRESVKRAGTGIWECRKCEYKFAGGTYVPTTSVGRQATRSIKKAAEGEGEEE